MDPRADMASKLTVDEAKALYDSGWWKEMEQADAAWLQLHQDLLCMPFSDFHEATEKLLGRPVWMHEFAGRDALIAEAESKRAAPVSPLHSLADIVGPERATESIVIAID